jgi:hypothetical protein
VLPSVPEPSWQRVPDQESLADSMMSGVAAGRTGYVAVGVADDDIGSGLGWTSVDGRIWERVTYDFPGGRPRGIIWDGAKFVAFASASAVWISPDGVSWSAASVVPGVDITNLSVASLDGRLYAIGKDSSQASGGVFGTWTSSDGLLWQPVVAETAPPLGLGNPAGFTAAHGLLLAWGFSSESEDDPSGPSAIVVSSVDGGRNWRSVTVGRAVNQIWDVIGLASGVLAVGSGPYCCDEGGSWPVRAWTSPDALTWNRATFLPETGNDKLKQVVPYAGGYVALGTDYGDPMSWRSDDGTVWIESSSVPDAAKDQTSDCTGGPCPNTYVTDLAAGDLGLVAVGENYVEVSTDDDYYLVYRSVIWIAPPAGD